MPQGTVVVESRGKDHPPTSTLRSNSSEKFRSQPSWSWHLYDMQTNRQSGFQEADLLEGD